LKVDLGIWSKLTRLVIFLLCVAGCTVIGLWYLPVIRQNERLRQEKLRVEVLIQKEEQEGRRLKSAIDSLKYDPKAVERLARESFGYAKEGETVIRFEGNRPPARF
jgi:cell division protein FtsB